MKRMQNIPLIERTEVVRNEDSDVPRVWYRVSSPTLVDGEFRAGDWVTLLARIHSVRTSGGYETGETPPGAEEKPLVLGTARPVGLEFRLEQNEIYLLGRKGKGKNS